VGRVGWQMDNFAFIIHPIEPQKDVARKYPVFGRLPPGIIDYFSRFFPPVYLSHITGICSEATGKEIEGWLIACPLTPKRMMSVSEATAYSKVIQSGQMAERLGANILGLGAFTSVVGDAGLTISRSLDIPVTTGNSYTVAVAVAAALEAVRRMGRDSAGCTAAVVGAYGATGRACALLLARQVPRLVLIGRQQAKLREIQEQVSAIGTEALIDTSMRAISQADLVLTVTSAFEPIIEAEHLKSGAVVCDVARPRNVARYVAEQRRDVLVIEGGIVDLPGQVDFGFNFGFPPGKAYACMAETALLALEGRYESYSLGREVNMDRVEEMACLAAKHRVRLSGFRSFERSVTDAYIDRVRENAHAVRHQAS
jgi:fatty aldehyde-generating acyl-ACP reductase